MDISGNTDFSEKLRNTPKKVTFIRHAQSLFNANPSQDESLRDCSITQLGKEQAKTLNHEFDLLILTPLKRSQDTYLYSNIKTERVIINELFREHRVDICDFLDGEELVYDTEEETVERVKEALEFLKSLSAIANNIGVISHRDFIMILVKYLGLDSSLALIDRTNPEDLSLNLDSNFILDNCGSITINI